MRAELARTLITRPDVLLLDEPSNYLDLPAVEWLQRDKTDFAFVYLGYTDVAGHNHGWMSAPYVEAVANADRAIGLVMEAIENGKTAIIVTSDHGGHERTHGTEMTEDMTIPWCKKGDHVMFGKYAGPVSYTHLTLPTNREV